MSARQWDCVAKLGVVSIAGLGLSSSGFVNRALRLCELRCDLTPLTVCAPPRRRKQAPERAVRGKGVWPAASDSAPLL